MKALPYALATLLSLQFALVGAQDTIPNGNFEVWSDEEPVNWTYRFHYAGFQNVFQSDDAREGNSSAELKPLYFGFLGDFPVANLLSDTFAIIGKPEMMTGFFKGSAAGTDSFVVDITLFDGKDAIGSGRFETVDAKTEWTMFSVPVTYSNETAQPDECAVSILAGKEYDFSEEGTLYKVDDLRFSNPTGIQFPLSFKPRIFPNPAADFISVGFTLPEAGQLSIEILSIQGKVIYSGETAAGSYSGTIQINIRDLGTGLYILRINTRSDSFSQKFMVNK